MSESSGKTTSLRSEQDGLVARPAAKADQPEWETPKMEDVSEQVMAQPYIRFT